MEHMTYAKIGEQTILDDLLYRKRMIYITFEHVARRLEFENSFHRRLFCCGEQI